MSQLTGKDFETLIQDLCGTIFYNPANNCWEPADEYLSGNIRQKLLLAESLLDEQPELSINVDKLTEALPKPLEASEIEVRLGATWLSPQYILDFIREVFQPAAWMIDNGHIDVNYSTYSGNWNIKGKSIDSYSNVLTRVTYGTERVNAYYILEKSLNLKDVRIFDTVYLGDGKEKKVLNKNETIIAQQKQEALKECFRSWIFSDHDRREGLVKQYNTLFNSNRNREFDGSNIVLHGVSPDITLRDYQLNAIARTFSGNTLLAHCVGAGKTYEMTASCMESIYLKIAHKALFVVPNHLIGQWAREFLQLYPGAKILVSRKKDFEPANRKKFCSRIATGCYDAVIIGHSQFEKIPLSKERQLSMLEDEIYEIICAIDEAKQNDGENFTVKQMVRTRKSLEAQFKKLMESKRDDAVTFEELGIDRIYVDEAHNYKNLYLFTKMRNVAGISNTKAKKSSDMFYKCRYLDELTDHKGVVFATGTPLSNSMTELYTMMRYLEYDRLREQGLEYFDSWASNYTEQTTAIELSPEGTGYRAKTRLARFYNLPELMNLFKDVADIYTSDQLTFALPEAEFINVVLKPSYEQKDMLSHLVKRAEAVRNGGVDASIDNMLLITNDGRKLALDQRLLDSSLPESENSKVDACSQNILSIWEADQKATQMVFCDLSTPNPNQFNVYHALKDKLLLLGVPESEIAFIHDANTDAKKEDLFNRVRSSRVRVLIGSTAKMGCGTNVQNHLKAIHHLDCPWRPSDIEQREGRMIRQGNLNTHVTVFKYITEETFDSYSWQIVENKQKFIGQIMTSKSPSRSAEDIDEQSLTYGEIKALATGNPLIKEKMDLDIKVARLKVIKANFDNQRYTMEDQILTRFPQTIQVNTEKIRLLKDDVSHYQKTKPESSDNFVMVIDGRTYTERKEAGVALLDQMDLIKADHTPLRKDTYIGEYLGFDVYLNRANFTSSRIILKRSLRYDEIEFSYNTVGNLVKIDNLLGRLPEAIEICQTRIEATKTQLKNAKLEMTKPFPQEQELSEAMARLVQLNAELSLNETETVLTEEPEAA